MKQQIQIPRWLKIQEKVDYYLWELNHMLKVEKNLTAMEKMIDEATGFSKEKMGQAKRIMTKINKLVKEYRGLTE